MYSPPLGLSSGRFPSVLRFRLYQTLSDPISSVLSRFPLSRFPFRRFRLYQILSGLIPSQRGLSSRLLGRSDVSNFSGFLPAVPNRAAEPNRIEFGHAEFDPGWEIVLMVWCAACAAEVLSQNRYGSVATRRTLRIRQVAVKHPLSRSFSPGR